MNKYFAQVDAAPGNTLVIFENVNLADAYVMHRLGLGNVGLICRVEDTRTGSGLVVQWRDPINGADLPRRQAEALWTLEAVLDGRIPMPKPGVVEDVTPEMRVAADGWPYEQ